MCTLLFLFLRVSSFSFFNLSHPATTTDKARMKKKILAGKMKRVKCVSHLMYLIGQLLVVQETRFKRLKRMSWILRRKSMLKNSTKRERKKEDATNRYRWSFWKSQLLIYFWTCKLHIQHRTLHRGGRVAFNGIDVVPLDTNYHDKTFNRHG